jgi:chemotaxis protein methyltransferase CheR
LNIADITDHEFDQFRSFIYGAAGISLSEAKRALVCGRLAKRLQHYGLRTYGDYFGLITSGAAPEEVQTAIDLLTTNETYFFREAKHFEHIAEQAVLARGRTHPFRVWSAASSSGEEAYSIAMVLADRLGTNPWEVIGSDISLRVLRQACAGHYSMERAQHIPQAYLRRFCLKGIGRQEGTLLVERSLRERVQFMQVNLTSPLPQIGMFEVIFLRNLMIYFDLETKRQVVARVISVLKPGGHLYIGHSESLNGITDAVRLLAPSIYRKQ